MINIAKCYRVMIHGSISNVSTTLVEVDDVKSENDKIPDGFVATRYVMASSSEAACERVKSITRNEIVKLWPRFEELGYDIEFEIEEVDRDEGWKLVSPSGKGFTFYSE